jgi:large subunit ribosomal protein L1
MKRSKKYKAAAEKVSADLLYTPLSAMQLVKETTVTKYDSSIEVALVLGVDPKKADQTVRSTVNLPHGTGKTARVLVFAAGKRADEARAAGADIVGADELIDEVAKGRLDYDAVVSTPDLMGKVGRLGKVLGPRGLMPNPKTGTVTTDVTKAVNDIKGGKIEFRVDKNSNLHFLIGKASFTAEQLADNYAAAIEEIMRAKPASSKGRFIKKSVVSSTMGPGIALDPNFAREGGSAIQ